MKVKKIVLSGILAGLICLTSGCQNQADSVKEESLAAEERKCCGREKAEMEKKSIFLHWYRTQWKKMRFIQRTGDLNFRRQSGDAPWIRWPGRWA